MSSKPEQPVLFIHLVNKHPRPHQAPDINLGTGVTSVNETKSPPSGSQQLSGERDPTNPHTSESVPKVVTATKEVERGNVAETLAA